MVFQKKYSFWQKVKLKFRKFDVMFFSNPDARSNGFFDKNDEWVQCHDDGAPLKKKEFDNLGGEL